MLEEAVGRRLMTRTPRGIMLTSAGSALKAEAETHASSRLKCCGSEVEYRWGTRVAEL
jgi:hypothetical protein